MTYREVFGYAGGFFFFLAYFPYLSCILKIRMRLRWKPETIRATLEISRGPETANRVTWVVWSVLGGLLLFGYHSNGATNSIPMAVAGTIGPLLVAAVTLKFNSGERLTWFEKTCALMAAAGLFFWYMTGDSVVAMRWFIFADLMGGLPTAKRLWDNPQSESLPAWALWLSGSSCTLISLERWTEALALYPAYFVVTQLLMTTLALRRYRRRELSTT